MERAGVAAGIARQAEQGSAGRNVSARSFHSLRHTFVTALSHANVAVELRQTTRWSFKRGAEPPLHAPRIRCPTRCHREAAAGEEGMSKAKTPRKRTFSFEGTKVIVAAAILNKWDKFPVEKKVAFIDAAYERQISNVRTEAEKGLEELWQRERALSEDLEALRKISVSSPEKSASGTSSGGLIRGSCGMPQRRTKGWQGHFPALADSIESPPRIYARSPSCAESWSATGRLRKGFACVGCRIPPWRNSCVLPVPGIDVPA